MRLLSMTDVENFDFSISMTNHFYRGWVVTRHLSMSGMPHYRAVPAIVASSMRHSPSQFIRTRAGPWVTFRTWQFFTRNGQVILPWGKLDTAQINNSLMATIEIKEHGGIIHHQRGDLSRGRNETYHRVPGRLLKKGLAPYETKRNKEQPTVRG
ncbi:hypothetical protein BJV78DRAFT_188281 [Lactifluus subvellereus]|nr:hypothetical protein BJV78DRAFT_188281 [Lactifluus subvellereus]